MLQNLSPAAVVNGALSPNYLDVYEISMNKCMGLPPRFGVEAFSTDLKNKVSLQYVEYLPWITI